MKSFDEFVASSQDAHQASLDKANEEVKLAAKDATSFDDMWDVIVASSAGHTNRLLRAYHEWLASQLD